MNFGGILLGLDVGSRRIGVSRGDFAVKIASPLAPIFNDENVFANLANLIYENRAQIVVVGLPRENSGRETAQSEFSREFARNLDDFLRNENARNLTNLREKVDVENLNLEDFQNFSAIKICFQDESLTSVAAEKILRARKNFNEKMLRDGTLDSEAAAIILQDFLEENSGKSLADLAEKFLKNREKSEKFSKSSKSEGISK